MSKQIVSIPLGEIARVKIYINTGRLPLSKVVAQEGPDVAITGNFWDYGTWLPVCPLKAAGRAWCTSPEYHYPALAWDTGPDIHVALIPPRGASTKANYIANGCGIYGGVKQQLHYKSDVAGRRGRAGWGFLRGDLGLIAFPDGSDGMTPEELRDYAFELGFSDFIMGDGGRKVNYYSKADGVMLQGKDPSQNLILIYLKKEGDKPVDGITQAIMTKSDCYKAGKSIAPKGVMVHSTATPGADADAIRATWDQAGAEAAVHYIIDGKQTLQTLPDTCRAWHCGGAANNTHLSFEICEPQECRLIPIEWVAIKRGSSGWAVQRLQMELQARGYDPKGVDGSFGPGCEAALRACQKDLGLTVDGSCGPATLAKLAARGGSHLTYDPRDTQDYFEAVWARAVALCAGLCKRYGLTAADILCHSEGFTKGVASNHADVMHWFPLHGKDMNAFRAAVKEAVGGAVRADPLAEAVDKLAAAGIISSPDYWKGGDYSADNVKALIVKMAAKI